MSIPEPMAGCDLFVLRLVWGGLFLLFLVVSAVVFRVLVPRWRSRARLLRWMTAATTVVGLLLSVELWFAFLFRQSDGYGHTLASRLWFERHWQPINAHGFRDRDHGALAQGRVLLVLGDSFAAGHGIEDVRDRFADLVGERLGGSWVVVLLARNGWDTAAELEAARRFPHRPEVIVLSYFVNDIQGAADAMGWRAPPYVRPPSGIVGWVAERSFAVNWAYWRVQRRSVGGEYWDYIQRCFRSSAVWFAHATELQGFVNLAAAREAKLVVLVWPDLTRVEASTPMTGRVATFFETRGVAVVDMTRVTLGRAPGDLVVNPFDPHPNRGIHREAAELLAVALKGPAP